MDAPLLQCHSSVTASPLEAFSWTPSPTLLAIHSALFRPSTLLAPFPPILQALTEISTGATSDAPSRAHAHVLLGLLDEFPRPFLPDFPRAHAHYLAALPHPIAAARLAFLSRYGRPGVPADRAAATTYAAMLPEDAKGGAPGPHIAWLLTAARAGWAPAQHVIATCYHDGVGLAPAHADAFAWYARAAGQGLPPSITVLGYCYADGLGVPRDPRRAYALYTEAAAMGDPVAIYNVGYCEEIGVGVSPDPASAARNYRIAAEAGHAVAQNALGYCYEDGIGLIPDLSQAVAWYRHSAEGGYMWAQCNLAFAYQSGRGLPIDLAQGAAWYERAARQGLARAQHNLGHCYQHGRGVPRDLEMAVTWYRSAASAGSRYALHSLGYCHQHGLGLPRDRSRAREAYGKAIAAGHVPAMLAMAALLREEEEEEEDVPTPPHPQEAPSVRWLREAAKAGDPAGADGLGLAFRYGRGVKPCLRQARLWFREGARRGHSGAMLHLASLLAFPAISRPKEETIAAPLESRKRRRISQGFGWYGRAASAGSVEGMVAWGRLLIGQEIIDPHTSSRSSWPLPRSPTPPRIRSGRRWLRRAAAAGSLEAMLSLSDHLFASADAAPQADPLATRDRSEARIYIRRAAMRGDLSALQRIIAIGATDAHLSRGISYGIAPSA